MTDALWELPAMLMLFFIAWAVVSTIPWFRGPSGGYGIHSDGQDWGDFFSPILAFAMMALIVKLLRWEL